MSGPFWRIAAELCLEIGCPHPDLLFDDRWGLDWPKFLDWVAYHEESPFGDRRRDHRLSVLFWAALAPHAGSPPLAVPQPFWPYWTGNRFEWDLARQELEELALESYSQAIAGGGSHHEAITAYRGVINGQDDIHSRN